MQNSACQLFCNLFFWEILEFFWKFRQNSSKTSIFKRIRKFHKKSNFKNVGQSDNAFLLLFLNLKPFENQKSGWRAMTQNVRVLMWSETGKLSCYSKVLHISGVAAVSPTKKDVFINTIIYVDCKNAIKLLGSRLQKNFIFFWYIRYIGKKMGFFCQFFFFSPLLTDILHIGHF